VDAASQPADPATYLEVALAGLVYWRRSRLVWANYGKAQATGVILSAG
jgi:hypothetical protein